jgi:hypothetical protein
MRKCKYIFWNILRIFGIFYDHLVHFVFIWYIFSGFGIMHLEKSGNPALLLSPLLLCLKLKSTAEKSN